MYIMEYQLDQIPFEESYMILWYESKQDIIPNMLLHQSLFRNRSVSKHVHYSRTGTYTVPSRHV
jgi:hypothetical protein